MAYPKPLRKNGLRKLYEQACIKSPGCRKTRQKLIINNEQSIKKVSLNQRFSGNLLLYLLFLFLIQLYQDFLYAVVTHHEDRQGKPMIME